jgi:P27 family predicted phage terminase small subunit
MSKKKAPEAQEMPPPPAHLSAAAAAEWQRILPVMHAEGLVTALDTANITSYCLLFARITEAQAAIDAEGAVIVTPSGIRRPNPWLSIQNTAIRQISAVSQRLGLSPNARMRVERTDAWHNEENRILNGL